MYEEIYNFGQHVSSENPCNVIMAGVSYCDSSYVIDRSNYKYNHFAIEYILEGQGVLEVNSKQFELQKNDTYFLYKGSNHKYYCKDGFWTKIWVVFDGEFMNSLLESYLPEKPNVLKSFDIQRYMESIIHLAKNENKYEYLSNQIAVIIHKIAISAKAFLQDKEEYNYQIIKNYIDDNVEQPFSLDELKIKLNYSKNYIIKIFKEQYGVTPYAYYMQKRMEIAKEYLKNTNMSINDISTQLNFDTVQYFSKCFKKNFGVSPLKYRNNI